MNKTTKTTKTTSERIPGVMSKLAPVALAVAVLAGCSTVPNSSNTNERISDHLYLGFGVGRSNLDPDASQSSTFSVDNRIQTTTTLNAGVDLSRQWALDFQAANLGAAGFAPNGDIEYREINASALLYVGGNRHRFKRQGFTAFGRFGGGFLDNTSNGVPFSQANGFHVLIGLGAEYMTDIGLGIRAEVISYDEDINLGQLGLIYRFGRHQERKILQTVSAPVEEPAPIAKVEPAPVVEAALPEACLQLNGVAEGVNFHSDSADLTEESIGTLSKFAETIAECASANITVTAHTDSHGDETYNDDLSLRRANSVVRFFEQNGINKNRMNPVAFGERLPIATNDTSEGRALNRRVELLIEQD